MHPFRRAWRRLARDGVVTTAEHHPRYRSTRGSSDLVSFREALLAGLAPDGGLYVPDFVPRIPEASWRGASSFPELASGVMQAWLGREVQEEVLTDLLSDAFNFDVPLVPLRGRYQDTFILELFHGPTLSFKDFGARTMSRLMSHFLQEADEEVTVLVATSGDTGSAVADGFAGQGGIQVALLYPKGQVSAVQERQLIVRRPGVRAFAVEGTFDDCQHMVKAAFLDKELAQHRLSSANSINIGRLLPQSLYYYWAVRTGEFNGVNFCVPSGNLGNLTAGVLAGASGVPVNRYLAAHNANDFFPHFLRGDDASFSASVRTLSNAMDVGAPSNFERLAALFTREQLMDRIWGSSVSDEVTVRRMKHLYDETGYVADPHTSVGLEAVVRYRDETGDRTPVVVLSTAHPAKFPETIAGTLGIDIPAAPAIEALWQEEISVEKLRPTPEALREALLFSYGSVSAT